VNWRRALFWLVVVAVVLYCLATGLGLFWAMMHDAD